MRYFLCFVLFFSYTIACCQNSYVFDQILEYEVTNPQELVQKKNEQRFYFVNSKDNSYVAIATQRKDSMYSLIFRDDQKDKIAELTVSKETLINANDLRIKKKTFKGNTYRNPVSIGDYDLVVTPHDSLLSVYTYSFNKSKGSNQYLTKSHILVVDKSVDRLMIGVGFGDYYSLLPWGDQFPKGLIRESLTERLDGSVVSYCILINVLNRNKTFVIE